jgi:hypothetical protein
LYPGAEAAWHFVSVPKEEAEQIRALQQGKKRKGFGSVPVKVSIGTSTWKTSIFPDKKSGTYLLPLKASVRKKEGIFSGDPVALTISLN